MVVKVIVNHGTRAPDKLYDYFVPEEIEDKISIGSRLKVPFGAKNREVEAYVFGIKMKSNARRLKAVTEVYDRAFDEKMLPLIEWMRDSLVCTYIDIIKVIVPRGSINKPDELIGIATESCDEVSEALKKHGGELEINELLSCFDTDMSQKINDLVRKGILKRTYRDRYDVKSAKVRVAYSVVEPDMVADVIKSLQNRAPVQAKMLDILSSTTRVSLADLVRFSDGNYGALRALEKKGYIKCTDVQVFRNPVRQEQCDEKKILTPEQQTAFNRISESLGNGFYEFLLHGVTGSGKTEVFLHAIDQCIENGKKAIMLVPEISLTPQMVSRFSARFGERIAVFHSGLSMGEKYDEWCRIRDGKADIVIGARSAVFAPFDDIGMIIIDEEHEQSYKSEMQPRYNTHEVARFRAKQHSAILVLASATPKIESYYDALNGKKELLTINNRVNDSKMPGVEIVDMRDELAKGNRSILSVKLREEIEENIKRKEQTILLLNRRGFSTFVSCRSCGYVAQCPNCSISLTYHKFSDTLRCHYCGHTIPNYTTCPSCNSSYIRYFGGGTQKVEEEIFKLFPDATVMRMDNDTTSGKGGHERILSEFEQTKADILIGTQMVAKGLDFPNVTLVGVISADTSLFADDFHAAERTFDLLEQVTGRAGRADKVGRAVIQTYSPENPAVVLAAKHDYRAFFDGEIKVREAMNYPPYCDIASVSFSGPDERTVSECAKRFARVLSDNPEIKEKVRIIGPIRAAVAKIQNKYRWQLIIKMRRGSNITPYLAEANEHCRKNKNYETVIIVTDKNPNTIF
ncbi:MAG: primosomal protein N' [Eubacteriales bacterium]|nr:primosomal protein N' [Eubacteriales bacterium]